MRRNALFAHGIEIYCSWCAGRAVLRTDFIAGRSKFPDSSQLHRQSKRGAGSLQSIGNPYGYPRVNPYRLKLQAHPYGNRACSRTDFGAQFDTLDETQPDHISKGISGWRQTSSRLGTAGDDGLTNISVRQDLF